ncbi:MAG: hypothetical protein ACLFP9_00400 [Desulfonatronovibrio sp.]
MSQEKIKPVGNENLNNSNPTIPKEEISGTKKDMATVGIIISVLAVFLLVVFYFAINKNVDELSGKVELITETRDKLHDMDNSLTQMDQRIADLENMPQLVKTMILGGMLQEISQKAEYIGANVNDEQKGKLEQARKLMNEVEKELTAK